MLNNPRECTCRRGRARRLGRLADGRERERSGNEHVTGMFGDLFASRSTPTDRVGREQRTVSCSRATVYERVAESELDTIGDAVLFVNSDEQTGRASRGREDAVRPRHSRTSPSTLRGIHPSAGELLIGISRYIEGARVPGRRRRPPLRGSSASIAHRRREGDPRGVRRARVDERGDGRVRRRRSAVVAGGRTRTRLPRGNWARSGSSCSSTRERGRTTRGARLRGDRPRGGGGVLDVRRRPRQDIRACRPGRLPAGVTEATRPVRPRSCRRRTRGSPASARR